MKLAYLAYDKTALKAHPVLEQHFAEIDTYLVSPQTEDRGIDLLNLHIMANKVFIPSDVSLQTLQHKLTLQKIKSEYLFLKKNIFSGYNFPSEELAGTKKSVKQQFSLTDITGITFNKILNKHILQTESQQFIEYDYLILEAHQLVSELLVEKAQNIVAKPDLRAYFILNLEFSLQYKLHKQHLHHEFIFVNNINLKTIFDNWYICNLLHNKISVSLFVPHTQRRSEEFLSFVTQRTHDVMSNSFDAFNIGELLRRDISPADGFIKRALKLRHPKNSAAFPSFTYWSQNKINDYIQNMFLIKNKKNKHLFSEKNVLKEAL